MFAVKFQKELITLALIVGLLLSLTPGLCLAQCSSLMNAKATSVKCCCEKEISSVNQKGASVKAGCCALKNLSFKEKTISVFSYHSSFFENFTADISTLVSLNPSVGFTSHEAIVHSPPHAPLYLQKTSLRI